MLLIVLALATSAFADPPPSAFDGRCFYPPGLGDPVPLEVRTTCNRVVTGPQGVDFLQTAWDARMLSFSGRWEEDRLVVETVTERSGRSYEARGLCRIYRADEEVSVIACTAVQGARSWIGNFRVSGIDG
ncbi:hypothetical protein [Tsuneonella sp. HG222]